LRKISYCAAPIRLSQTESLAKVSVNTSRPPQHHATGDAKGAGTASHPILARPTGRAILIGPCREALVTQVARAFAFGATRATRLGDR
jgi:hypothetical protein